MKRSIRVVTPILVAAALTAATRVTDPETFVRGVYDHYLASQRTGRNYVAPADIYTARLKALFDEDKRRANGEVGCIEFDFWVNGQDWNLKNIRVTAQDIAGSADRKMVNAEFVNDTPQELRFDFRRIGGVWLLDDVESLRGERWKLSALLSCWTH
ncbi:MAG TPA: hypothetical protein VKB88_39370 [Bryobacteraceae bacterium]|nr:hypothetical protein [Bryobacteraceae bacterium]